MLEVGRVEVVFAEARLAAVDAGTASLGLGPGIDENFRDAVDFLLGATDERDLRNMKSWHFEKLKGRGEDRSIRLNDQWRLILRFEGNPPNKRVVIVGVEDYH